MTNPPVLAICGFSGSGKTSLLEAVIPRLTADGLAAAVVKHDAHGVLVDPAGKDSDRLFRAGADVLLTGPDESLSRRHAARAPSLDEVVTRLAADYDVVLVEGHKTTALPKLWLLGDDETSPPESVTDVRRVLRRDEDRVEATVAEIAAVADEAWRRRPLLAGILIGGGSRRMGQPKQLLELDGRTFVERVVAALSDFAEKTVLLGDGAAPPALAGLQRLPDALQVHGPAGGLLAALRWEPRVTWVVAATDQPLVEPPAVRWLLDRRRPGVWAVLPRPAGGEVEPFLAVYEPQMLRVLERQVCAGRLGPRHLVDHPNVESPEPPADLVESWRGVNTPEEYEDLRS